MIDRFLNTLPYQANYQLCGLPDGYYVYASELSIGFYWQISFDLVLKHMFVSWALCGNDTASKMYDWLVIFSRRFLRARNDSKFDLFEACVCIIPELLLYWWLIVYKLVHKLVNDYIMVSNNHPFWGLPWLTDPQLWGSWWQPVAWRVAWTRQWTLRHWWSHPGGAFHCVQLVWVKLIRHIMLSHAIAIKKQWRIS